MQQVTEIYGRENGWSALNHHKVESNHGCSFIRRSRSWKRGSSGVVVASEGTLTRHCGIQTQAIQGNR
jgi:hypothetical protein